MGRFDRLRPWWTDALLAAGCATLALWVYRSVRGAYFSPDDLILLERVRGLAPRLATAWRYLSGQAYFDLLAPWFGVDPRPWMLASWLLHGACAALLYAWARRHGGRLSAVLTAGAFGASRLFYSVVSQVVGVGEMLALAFTLAACLAISASRRAVRLAALPLFVAALLSKESVALLPLALLFSPAVGATLRERLRRAAPLLAASLGLALYLVIVGVHKSVLAGRAYETGFGPNLVGSLVLYAAWSLDLHNLTPDYYGASTPVPWGWGIGLIMVMAVAAWATRRRTRAPAVGAAWWLLGLLPVLPLLWQRYLNYLYAPSAGLALVIGGLLEWGLARERKSRPTSPATRRAKGRPPRAVQPRRAPATRWIWGVVVVLLIGYAAWSESLLRQKQESRLGYADIPLDPGVRKMELARRVATRVEAALGGRRARIVFYIPEAGKENRFFAELMESVLDHGRGLRAVCPHVDSAAFVSHWSSAYRDFDLFAGSLDGLVDHMGRGPESHLALAAKLLRFRLPRNAEEHLAAASEAYPEDARLPLARSAIVAQLGRVDEARALCRRAIELEPTGVLADSARAMLRRLDGTAKRD